MAPNPGIGRRLESREHWAGVTSDWIAWARTPGHDAYWNYRDELPHFLPPPGSATLDLGCGEGRVARDLTALGHRVTAADATEQLLDAAREAESAAEYRLCDAACLPFDDAAFDLVVAYNVLMDLDDMCAVLAESARVLAVDGNLAISVGHPFRACGRFDGESPEEPFVMTGNYFGSQHFGEVRNRNGLRMEFSHWHRSLEDYCTGLRRAGLAVTDLREPRPNGRGRRRDHRMPMFLWMLARPLPT